MKPKYLVAISLISLVFVLVACRDEVNKTSAGMDREYVGVIRDANVVPTSFNESMKMQIKTDRLVVTIATITTVPIGAKATIYTHSNGRYISWESSNEMYKIWE